MSKISHRPAVAPCAFGRLYVVCASCVMPGGPSAPVSKMYNDAAGVPWRQRPQDSQATRRGARIRLGRYLLHEGAQEGHGQRVRRRPPVPAELLPLHAAPACRGDRHDGGAQHRGAHPQRGDGQGRLLRGCVSGSGPHREDHHCVLPQRCRLPRSVLPHDVRPPRRVRGLHQQHVWSQRCGGPLFLFQEHRRCQPPALAALRVL